MPKRVSLFHAELISCVRFKRMFKEEKERNQSGFLTVFEVRLPAEKARANFTFALAEIRQADRQSRLEGSCQIVIVPVVKYSNFWCRGGPPWPPRAGTGARPY